MMTLCGLSSGRLRILAPCALFAALAPCRVAAASVPGAAPVPAAASAPAMAPAPADPGPAGAVIPLAPATDLPPPETPAPPPVPIGDALFVGGALDLRYRTSTRGRTHAAWINNAEFDLNYPIISHGRSLGEVVAQGIEENPAEDAVKSGVNLGEAYVIYQIPLGDGSDATAYVKAGRFQVPFALLATYDPHLLLIQPLYSQSLGIRDDIGVQVSGRFYGILNYDLSLTSGSSTAIFDARGKNVVTFRLGRTFYTRNGTVNVGGTMLSGRLPITDIDKNHPFALELPPSGRIAADRGVGFVNKTRIAGDGTLTYRKVTARGEVISGADGDQRVLGYFVEGDYKLGERGSVVAERSTWLYSQNRSSTIRTGVGFNYSANTHLTFRSLYEVLTDRPRDLGESQRQQLTLQALLRF